eukprot:6185814-Pleurochrysis_carterae.AAC.4
MGPTENDIQLERTWRRDIRATVLEHDLPMTREELDKLEEGVQYEQGRLMKGGIWGGGTEHQAISVMLKTNIVIWDRRYIDKVSADYKQIYICTTRWRMHLTNVAHAVGILRDEEHNTIHLLYDYAASHYEYFSRDPGCTAETTDKTWETEVTRKLPRKKESEMQSEGEGSGVAGKNNPGTMGEDTSESQQIGREGPKGENCGEHLPAVQIGTLNVSHGISYGYRGKYINTTENLLKIKPGDKLREVTEMMKTQEGLGGGGIAAKKEVGEGDLAGARRKAGIYYLWDHGQGDRSVWDIHAGKEKRRWAGRSHLKESFGGRHGQGN